MKFSNPKSRRHLSIKKRDKVLEVGPGSFPHPRANVVADKFVDTNYHRSGDLRVLTGQQFVNADGECLPFGDKSFDYSICCHVLEHVEDPAKFVSEQVRVASAGYLETPSIIGEYLMPKASHKWVLLEIDERIVMYEKQKIDFVTCPDLGFVFQKLLPKQSVGYKIMQRTHLNLTNVSYEWKDDLDVVINPESSYYLDFFTKPLGELACSRLFERRSLAEETRSALWAVGDMFRDIVKSKVFRTEG